MGCGSSTPVPEVYDFCHPIDPDIPLIGAKQGVEPSKEGPGELILHKKMLQGVGGNSYKIRTRKQGKQQFFYNLEVKGKHGRYRRDQMDLVDTTSKEPVAILLRSGSHKFEIYTPEPLFEGQTPSIKYQGGIPLFLYASVSWPKNSCIANVRLDNQTDDEKPLYQCRKDSRTKSFIYRRRRQCAFLQMGTHNATIVKINPGVDPCLMICLSAILDEMD